MLAYTEDAGHSEDAAKDPGSYRGRWTLTQRTEDAAKDADIYRGCWTLHKTLNRTWDLDHWTER